MVGHLGSGAAGRVRVREELHGLCGVRTMRSVMNVSKTVGMYSSGYSPVV